MGNDGSQRETLVTGTLCELFLYRTSCYLLILWHSSNISWARGEGFYPRTLYGPHSYPFWDEGTWVHLRSPIPVSNRRDRPVILTQSSFVKIPSARPDEAKAANEVWIKAPRKPCYRTDLWREAGVWLHRSNSSRGRLGLNLPRPMLSWWSMDFL